MHRNVLTMLLLFMQCMISSGICKLVRSQAWRESCANSSRKTKALNTPQTCMGNSLCKKIDSFTTALSSASRGARKTILSREEGCMQCWHTCTLTRVPAEARLYPFPIMCASITGMFAVLLTCCIGLLEYRYWSRNVGRNRFICWRERGPL